MSAAAASRVRWREADCADRARYSQAARHAAAHGSEAAASGAQGQKAAGRALVVREAGEAGLGQPGASCAAPAAGAPPTPQAAPGSHYQLLGVPPEASTADIRRAYRRRLVETHPDKGGDPAAFQALQAAFAVLADPQERLVYDERLERAAGGGASAVTAVVHGQTQGRAPEREQWPGGTPQRGACAGQPPGSCSELQAATAAIRELQGSGGGSGRGPALAAAHLRRAALHQAAGALHHALFDAEEALRVQSDCGEAAALVGALLAAAAAAGSEQPAGAAAGAAGSSSDDDGDPF